MSDFGSKVEEYLKRLGIKQNALAKRVGLSPAHLNRIVKGTRKPPHVEAVLAMVDALQVKRKEAEELIELAGYSPEVLQFGGRLAYDSPTIPGSLPDGIYADLTRLHAVLAKIPRHSQQSCIDALTTFIENLYPVNG